MTEDTRRKILQCEKLELKASRLLSKASAALSKPGKLDEATDLYLKAKTLSDRAQVLWEQVGVL